MRNFKSWRSVYFVLLAVYFCCCEQSERAMRTEAFQDYYLDFFGSELSDGKELFFVFEPACFECAQGVIDMIGDIKCDAMNIICLGEVTEENKQKLKEIAEGKNVHYDRQRKASRYTLGIEKGMFIHLEKSTTREFKSFAEYDTALVNYVNISCPR